MIRSRIALALAAVGLVVLGASLTGENKSAWPGQEVEIPVWFAQEDDDPVSGIQFDVVFDVAAFTWRGARLGEAAVAANKDLDENPLAPDEIRVLIIGFNQNIIPDGVVAYLKFQVNDGAASGDYAVFLDDALATDPSGHHVYPSVFHAGINVRGGEGEGEGEGGTEGEGEGGTEGEGEGEGGTEGEGEGGTEGEGEGEGGTEGEGEGGTEGEGEGEGGTEGEGEGEGGTEGEGEGEGGTEGEGEGEGGTEGEGEGEGGTEGEGEGEGGTEGEGEGEGGTEGEGEGEGGTEGEGEGRPFGCRAGRTDALSREVHGNVALLLLSAACMVAHGRSRNAGTK